MGRVEGKVAFITGAARGQGRSHAVRLAEEGADIIAVDIDKQIETVGYPLATSDELAETAKLVEKHGRRVITRQADVRDQAALDAAVADGLAEFGHIDIVCANAGIVGYNPAWEVSEAEWRDLLDVNLTGVWHTAKAVVPSMIEAERGGSIVITSSAAGIKGFANCVHYSAAKHGVVGVMRTLANELAAHRIRVNSVHPGTVNTDMVANEPTYRLFRPDLENPTLDDIGEVLHMMHALPVPWCEPIDISNAVLWLASDEARYVTGVVLPVDAGMTIK